MLKCHFFLIKICGISILFTLFFIYAHAAESPGQVSKIKISLEHIELSSQEKVWLEKHPVVQVAGPKSFPPFHFFENGAVPKGISADYMYIILNALGVQAKVHHLSWPEVLKKTKEKKIDLIACAAKTEDRMAYLNFSVPYLSFPLVIISRKEADFIGGIEDLNGKKLATIKKNSTLAWLKKDNIKFIEYNVGSPLAGLESVSFGRADARIENLAAASYLIQTYGLTNLKIAAPTPYGNYDLHMAVRKDFPELLSIIDKALAQMTLLDQSEITNSWLSVRYEHGMRKADIIKWILPVILFSFIILTLMTVWNRKLKKESYERKQVEKRLRASEKKYRHLFNNAPAGMYEIDFTKNKFISVNEVMCSYSGYTKEEFLTMNPLDLLTPESQKLYLKRLGNINAGKNFSEVIEYNIIKKDGGQLCVILNGDYFFKVGQLVGAQVVVHDITQLKQAEEDKIEAQKIVGEHEKLALVGKIAGKMAHDFNNILGIIMGNAELSILYVKDPKIKESFELIFEQTLRGKNLTKNLVAFAKDQEPNQKFFKLHEKIDLVLNLLKKDLEGIELIRKDKSDIPELLADPGMIEHVMVNLVQNAVHAVSQVKAPQIIIRSFCRGDWICFEIEDNGCGIPDEFKERIYEPAFSLKGSRDVTRSYEAGIKGTGYGMSNIKKYIEQHKGTIRLQSKVGTGSTFTITLPVIKKELSHEEKIQIQAPTMNVRKRILLVEDETDISNVQYRVLTQEPCNHKVDLASNVSSAIQLFDTKSYDFISLDYILPGNKTGMDVYEYIRKKDKTIPILFISGNFTFLESIKTLKQKDPCIDHLSKPCQNKNYVTCINQMMEKAEA